ncbi:PEP/pyruvate-binding domain-containing protein [Vreelandella lutescens]|uniref:Pyruvate, phosphate dikinase n=1 Tax=Vreelandella lutescens TaxID=1602943 RepID=A0ABQ1PM13_9GAMM|nr:PEP/pyruvate-binding domain-containing protein [Halomonas lutescens]GGC99251.1 pyruvate, phosphate dikinase [Halomonas lutescens]
MPKLIILGAGAPHHGKLPAALNEARSGTSILQWQLDACSVDIKDTLFVAGYKSNSIKTRHPDLPIVVNEHWESTGSATSLFTAPFGYDEPLLVCYSDVLFRSSIPKALTSCEADIAVAWDSAWKHRYVGRNANDLLHRELVMANKGYLTRLGENLPVDWANGEFIGLVRFSPAALKFISTFKEYPPESLRKSHLSEYIEYLRANGLSIAGVDVAGDWAEYNAPQDIARFILGTKAETLSRLRGMMSHAVIQDQEAFSVQEWQANPNLVIHNIVDHFGDQPLVVRSSAHSEDSFDASNAGGYDSVLNVLPGPALKDAIQQVILSYGKSDNSDQVLVQPMVSNVQVSGVAFTRTLVHGAPWYVINYETNGNTEAITSGASTDHRTLLLRRQTADTITLPEPRLAGLIKGLLEIETLLEYDALDIEFAIDAADTVHILQVRPIAVDRTASNLDDKTCDHFLQQAKMRWKTLSALPPHLPGKAAPIYGVMPDWNPAEIIGTTPSALAKSLYRYLILDETWATQRAEYGYRDVRPAPLLTEFAGHPYIDVRASFASFIPANVPEALAGRLLDFTTNWLRHHPELHDKIEFDVVPTCLGPNFNRWEQRLLHEGGFKPEEVGILKRELSSITSNAFYRCQRDLDFIEQLEQRFETLKANTALAPLERARLLLGDCRRLGTLPFAHLARSSFIAVTLLKEAEATGAISRAARESFLSTIRTVSHQFTDDAHATAVGELSWETFIDRYGHLRPGTYDITSPRYDADPERYLRPLVEQSQSIHHTPQHRDAWQLERKKFFREIKCIGLPSDPEVVERFLRQSIEGREYAKFAFSRNLSAALEAFAHAGDEMGLKREQLANLPLDALLNLDMASLSLEDSVEHLCKQADQALRNRRVAAACEMPPLLKSIAELDTFILGADQPNFIGSNSVTASCLDLSQECTRNSTNVADYIVLIPQADPGYDWLFGQNIAGLITLYGGANSHMAIRAAEFSIPAAIGIGEKRYRELLKARVIELSPVNGLLRVVQ